MNKYTSLLSILLAMSFPAMADDNLLTVHMAGDSTMADKQVKDYPETGWGVPFAGFFDENTKVRNYAQNGRSTRTFLELGLWQSVLDHLASGDYVIIQFGHNDEAIKKQERYTTPEQYKANLTRFIEESRLRGAIPILMSPITRRYFDDNGTIRHTHLYAPLSIEVAAETGVEFIDMEAITRRYFQAMGERDSEIRFLHIPPDTHPNYPNGIRDNTHLNRLGAREVAQLVLAELKKRDHPLASRQRVPDPKHLKYSY